MKDVITINCASHKHATYTQLRKRVIVYSLAALLVLISGCQKPLGKAILGRWKTSDDGYIEFLEGGKLYSKSVIDTGWAEIKISGSGTWVIEDENTVITTQIFLNPNRNTKGNDMKITATMKDVSVDGDSLKFGKEGLWKRIE